MGWSNTMTKTPSAILSDALTAFNRAATLAFTSAQDQARKDITQATTDAREARRERDDAVNALHANRLDEQAWKQEAGVWKAAANQAELTINHHLETIAQLRQEATQWKNQCLRLEETARQEAISWKEQFLRVEQERLKLAQRVEELVEEQLASGGHAEASAAPYTPMPRYPATGDFAASTRLRCVSTRNSFSSGLQELPLSKSLSSMSKTTSNANRTRPGPVLQLPTPSSVNQRNARQRVTQDTATNVSQTGSTSNGTRQIVLRRVHAVVEVPVKEESVERDGVGLSTHLSPPNIASTSTATSASKSASAPKTSKAPPLTTGLGRATPRIKRKASAKRTYVEIDDEESEPDSVSHNSKQSDPEEDRPVSDGDDELLMGVETNRKEVYGMKRVPEANSLLKSTHAPIVAKKRKVLTATKKSRPSASSKP